MHEDQTASGDGIYRHEPDGSLKPVTAEHLVQMRKGAAEWLASGAYVPAAPRHPPLSSECVEMMRQERARGSNKT